VYANFRAGADLVKGGGARRGARDGMDRRLTKGQARQQMFKGRRRSEAVLIANLRRLDVVEKIWEF